MHQGRPEITVCIATRNHAQYLVEALESLRRQTLAAEQFEVVVIDDGSTDETPRLLMRWVSWVHVVSRGHRGLAASCNEGLGLARGRYFARMDSDDIVEPTWLTQMADTLGQASGACLAYPDRLEMDAVSTRPVAASAENIYSLEACGTLFRTDVLKDIGGFRSFFWEEYDLYLRLLKAGPWVHVPAPLYVYRKHRAGMTAAAPDRLDGWLELAREWGAAALLAAGSNAEMEQALGILERKALG